MSISVPSKSTQYTNSVASPMAPVTSSDWGSKLRSSHADLVFTTAGYTTAALGDIKLIRMPAGRVRLFPGLSLLTCPAGTSTSDLDIGIGEYYNNAAGSEGALVALAGIALADSLDVGGAALDQVLPLPAVGTLVINSQTGFDIVCSFDTANSPASGTMTLDIVFQQGN